MLVCLPGLTLVAQIFQKVVFTFFWSYQIFYPNLPIFYTDIFVKSVTFCNSDCEQIDVWDSHLEAAFTAKPGDRESSRVAFSPRGEPSSSNLQSRSQLLCRWPCVPEIRPFLRPFNWNPPFYCSLWMALNWKIGKGSGLGWLAIVDSLTRGDGQEGLREAAGATEETHEKSQRSKSNDPLKGFIRQTQPRLCTDGIRSTEAVHIWPQLHYMKLPLLTLLPFTPF